MPKSMPTLAKTIALGNLIQAEYAESGKTDRGFAEYAAEKLSSTVTEHNVAGTRKALGIQANYTLRRREPNVRLNELEVLLNSALNDLAELRAQVRALQQWQKTHP